MSKEFEKHNPNNSDCPITRQISIATCTCPEQKEEVVHAGGCAADLDGCYDGSCLSIPEQKAEKATPSTKILTGLQLHRNDCPVRFVNCICNFNADEVFDEVKKMVKEEPRTPKA